MKTTLDYAKSYIKNNIPVLPLHYIKQDGKCSCGGNLTTKCKAGKHPYSKLVPNGLKNASTDENTIFEWFNDTPYNVGIVTGNQSGFFVLDRDDKDGGAETLQAWESENGKLPETLKQKTGNGIHYFFKMPKGLDIRNSQKNINAPGIDVRGNGGYICAAPSKHFSGKHYELIDADKIAIEKIADAPEWLLQKINPPRVSIKHAEAVTRSLSDDLRLRQFEIPEKISDGQGRESFLLKYAGHLRNSGYDQNQIEQILLNYNKGHISPPLDDTLVLDRARRYQHQFDQMSLSICHENWPLHQNISDTLPPVPSLNIKMLPNKIDDLIIDIAERISCPPEFPAIAAIVALGSAIGSRIHCKPYRNATWLVPANVWGLINSAPSQQKSPPVSEVFRVLRTLDKESADRFSLDQDQYEIDKAIYEKSVKEAIKLGCRTPAVAPPLQPKMTRYIVNDTTYEKLIEIARDNPDGILIWRDELAGWFHSLNKENQKEARGLFLTGWSGTESYATDRIGRGHVRADSVTISILGTIQPDVLRSVVLDSVTGGVGNDGLIQRFQLAVYPDPVRTFKKPEGYPNFEAMQYFEKTIRALTKLDPRSIGAEFDLDGTPFLGFDNLAQAEFDKWRADLEKRLRDPESNEHPVMIAHLGKYRSLLPKLALILHLANEKIGPIGVESVLKAKAWTIFLEAHARRMYHTAINKAVKSANSLANKIKAGKLKDGFTRSDILLADWADLRTAEDITNALTVLKDKDWIVAYEDRKTGGRPSEKFLINPNIKRAA